MKSQSTFDPVQQTWRNLKNQIIELSKKQEELFNEHFQEIGRKRDMKPEQWIKAKFNVENCAVGELLQTMTKVYKRIS